MRNVFKFFSKSSRVSADADLEMKKNANGQFEPKKTKGEMLDGLLPLANFAHKGLGNLVYLAGFFALVLGGTQYINSTMRVYGSAGVLTAAIDYANPQQNPQNGMVTNCGPSLSGVFHTEDVVFTPHFACGEHVFVKSMETGKLTAAVVAHRPTFHEGSTRVADISLSLAQKLGLDEKTATASRIALASMDAKFAGVAQFVPYKDFATKQPMLPSPNSSVVKFHTQNLLGELRQEMNKYGAANMLGDLLAKIYVVENRVRLPQYPNTVQGVITAGLNRGKRCDFSWFCDGKADPTAATHPKLWGQAEMVVRNALVDNVPPRYAALRYTAGCATNYLAEKVFLQKGWKAPKWYFRSTRLDYLRGDVKFHTLLVDPNTNSCGGAYAA